MEHAVQTNEKIHSLEFFLPFFYFLLFAAIRLFWHVTGQRFSSTQYSSMLTLVANSQG